MADKVDIYNECYAYQGRRITLRQVTMDDAEDLLRCYSDEKAVKRFNDDNCHDGFHYTTMKEMQDAIAFWLESYQQRQFVRWTIVLNETHRAIGTVEMFGDDHHKGVLRLDVRSKYEEDKLIRDVLRIVDNFFYDVFDVTEIYTKCREVDEVRIGALRQSGYKPFDEKFHGFSDYYIRNHY